MAIEKTLLDQNLAVDVRSAQTIRSQLRRDQAAGIKAAAKEFEAMFLQMVMKSMRATTGQDSLIDSDSSRFFTGMLDEQTAKNLAGAGKLGLAELLEAQLTQQLNARAVESGATDVESARFAAELDAALTHVRAETATMPTGVAAWRAALERTSTGAKPDAASFASPKEFVSALWPHAVEASRDTGIPPQFLIAHAALETGWGSRNIVQADGRPSYNLFGIKAGGSWSGATAEIPTTEYENGVAHVETASFRAYASYADSFRDYARLLRDNPRYGGVIGSQNGTEFARRLQQAGYATDPAYAEKLAAIIAGPTLREALIG